MQQSSNKNSKILCLLSHLKNPHLSKVRTKGNGLSSQAIDAEAGLLYL